MEVISGQQSAKANLNTCTMSTSIRPAGAAGMTGEQRESVGVRRNGAKYRPAGSSYYFCRRFSFPTSRSLKHQCGEALAA